MEKSTKEMVADTYRMLYPLESYLARMDNILLAQWMWTRRKGRKLKAVDKLRIFFYAKYQAKRGIVD